MKFKKTYLLPLKAVTIIVITFSVIAVMSFDLKEESAINHVKEENTKKDSVESDKAYMDVYKV